ncbi:hypothetical protein [Bacillus atrophaeus]|uniref:hypothetical protein n=1 Tax=Bacillus atrophaeus TaxID=1452 RepID=UPI00077B1EBF|nr:hypothetical protein [Bacillus atrophaeus]KXZ16352.1 hypothetical protein AXI57_09205 [Bacillus atrophaeus]MCY8837438.1 hypothetical protein [Bacillus atrophaeus]MEC5220176.1 hypothetical protein [Bacillus atrophaeus]MED4581054.1 hypothetical protein [Bacillus atrophaeus]MED4720811.1 hypothetical protein [Bacillus atrophaeus]
MNKQTTKINWDYVFWIIIFSIILFDLIIYAGVTKALFGEIDTTILSACIAFIGAIIGGGITFIGVKKTIKANEDLYYRNELPKQLYRLDKVITDVDRINKFELPGVRGNNYINDRFFFSLTGQLKLKKRDPYKEFTVDYLEKFKDELIFVDGEGYKIWIEYKEKIIAIEKYYNTAEVLTQKFHNVHSHEYMQGYFNGDLDKLNKNIQELTDNVNQLEENFYEELSQIYIEFQNKLTSKQDRMIKEMDF